MKPLMILRLCMLLGLIISFRSYSVTYTMYERSGYPYTTTVPLEAAVTMTKINEQTYTVNVTNNQWPTCSSLVTPQTCTFKSTYYTIEYQAWFPGDPNSKPFPDIVSSETQCSFVVLVGNYNAAGWTGKSMNATSANMMGNAGMLYDGDRHVVNKKCADVTRADIGIISGSVTGWGFSGRADGGGVSSCGIPCPFGNPVMLIVSVIRGNSNQPSNAVTSVSVNSGGNVNQPSLPVSCTLAGDFNLEHGSIGKNEINGNTSNTNISISCSDSTSVITSIVSNSGDNKVDMGGGIVSTITAMPSTVTVSAGTPSSMVLSSSLNSTGNPVGGDYSGSATLITTYR